MNLVNYGDSDEEDFHQINQKCPKKIRISVPELVKEKEEDVTQNDAVLNSSSQINGCKLVSLLPKPQINNLNKGASNLIPRNCFATNESKKGSINYFKQDIVKSNRIIDKDVKCQVPIILEKIEPKSDEDEDANITSKNENNNSENFFFSCDEPLEELKNHGNSSIPFVPIRMSQKQFDVESNTNSEIKKSINNEILHEENIATVSSIINMPIKIDEDSIDNEMQPFDHNIELHKFMPKKDRCMFQNLPSSVDNMQATFANNSSIQLIDANADELLNSQDVERNLTKEISADHPPDLSKFKKDITQQQKRKHQITYLAFQAKEREYELQKQWAAGRMSRQESRSKYGF